MDDLISLKAAIEAVREAYENEETLDGYEYRLNELPCEEPRMKGKWNTYYHGGTDFSYSCARCGYGAPFDMSGGKVFQKKWNYCPNCGADMAGKNHE